jgi:hypothetical protein
MKEDEQPPKVLTNLSNKQERINKKKKNILEETVS